MMVKSAAASLGPRRGLTHIEVPGVEVQPATLRFDCCHVAFHLRCTCTCAVLDVDAGPNSARSKSGIHGSAGPALPRCAGGAALRCATAFPRRPLPGNACENVHGSRHCRQGGTFTLSVVFSAKNLPLSLAMEGGVSHEVFSHVVRHAPRRVGVTFGSTVAHTPTGAAVDLSTLWEVVAH